VLANVGTLQRGLGAFSQALETWDEAWRLTKDDNSSAGRAVADYVLAEWLTVAASFGQTAMVDRRVEELQTREIRGAAGAKARAAFETAQIISLYPDQVISSGPESLRVLLEQQGVTELPGPLAAFRPAAGGTSLAEIETLADGAGLSMRAARRGDRSDVPVPSVVHWKLGHFSPVLERQGDRYRIVDVALGGTLWIARDVLLAETSDALLVSSAEGRDRWPDATPAEAATIIGRSCPAGMQGEP
jgi:hypothetical protein